MLFKLKKESQLLDEASIIWMFDVYAWALKNFGISAFKQSQLVNPSNEHFPGRANSVEEMVSMVFDRVVDYAGMSHWPFQLANEAELSQLPSTPTIQLEGPARQFSKETRLEVSPQNSITITFHPHQINDPEVLIGSYAHALAHYLGTVAQESPPGGSENWPQITEVLAVFLGFGVIMANSAYTNKVRSCGSCAGPVVERMNFLSQHDLTYALAIFATLKEIPNKVVLRHLKKSLQGFYKKSIKDIQNHSEKLQELTEKVNV